MSIGSRVMIALVRHVEPYEYLRGVYRYAASVGNWSLAAGFSDPSPQQFQAIRNGKIDGLLVSCHDGIPDDLEFLRSFRRPIVSLTTDTPADVAPYVSPDHRAAFLEVFKHFEFLGVKRAAFLGLKNRAGGVCLQELFQELAAPANLGRDSLLLDVADHEEALLAPSDSGELPSEFASWLLGLPPGAGVICQCARLGDFVIRAAKLLRRAVPGDLAVVGLGDSLLAPTTSPPLTTYDLPREELGFHAAALLDRLMHGEPRPDGPVVVPGGRLIVRGSTQQLPDPVQAALKIIRTDATHGLTVKDMVKQTGVRRVVLEKLFANSIGHAPGEAIRLERLDVAKRLLTETELKVESVAEQSGFESVSSFSRFFRARTGHAPGEFRRLNGKRPQ